MTQNKKNDMTTRVAFDEEVIPESTLKCSTTKQLPSRAPGECKLKRANLETLRLITALTRATNTA